MTARAGDHRILYEALAGLFAPPSWEMLEFVASPRFSSPVGSAVTAMAGSAADAAQEAVTALTEAAGCAELEPLEVEYARLFLGPGAPIAPPWESAWITEQMAEQGVVPVRVVEAVGAAYAAAGCALEPGPEPADYLGVELDFLAVLSERAGVEGEDSQAALLHDAFVREHLGAWAPRLAETVMREARLPFYAAAARLLAAACA